jgi:uncharacterized repeat protein (TIGR03803 family)
MAPTAVPAQTFTTLASFNGTDGATPYYGALVQGLDGNLYGMTNSGGNNGDGNIFKITDDGSLISLYSFCYPPGCADGYGPTEGLDLATNGNFYGTTSFSGADAGYGSLFQITAGGKLTTLHSFCPRPNCTDGTYPAGGLVQGTSSKLYGTTRFGAINGGGTVFAITTAGKLTTLFSFSGSDGYEPYGLSVQSHGWKLLWHNP